MSGIELKVQYIYGWIPSVFTRDYHNIVNQLSVQFSSVQSLRRVGLFVTPWIVAGQASLSITNSWSIFKLMSIELIMPSNHLILYRPLLLPPSIFPSIRIFSNESALRIRWPKYWSFSFSISPSSEYWGLISFRMDWLDIPQYKIKSFKFKKKKNWKSGSKPILISWFYQQW